MNSAPTHDLLLVFEQRFSGKASDGSGRRRHRPLLILSACFAIAAIPLFAAPSNERSGWNLPRGPPVGDAHELAYRTLKRRNRAPPPSGMGTLIGEPVPSRLSTTAFHSGVPDRESAASTA